MLTLQEISDLVVSEERKSDGILHLTANETLLSPQAQKVLASPLYNRYLLEHVDMREESPSRLGGFLYRGLDSVNVIERSALEACKVLFGAQYAEFRCLSGLHAMQTTIASLTKPGDMVMRFETKDGGHFATQHLLKLLGRRSCCYVFDKSNLQIDLAKTKKIIQRENPSLLYIDAMNYLFPFPLAELKDMAKDVCIVYDASHTLGLIAGGQFQNPLKEGADVLQANTHKTFFGPQKGIILTNNREVYEKISYDLSHGLVSSQHTTSSLALFISLHEMIKYGKEYASKIVHNAQYFAEKLQNKGFKITAKELGFTKNHQFFIDVTDVESGPVLLERMLRANISINRTIPFEKVDALRIGVQEVTRRGYCDQDFDLIAEWFSSIVFNGQDPLELAANVSKLVHSRSNILYCDEIVVKQTEEAGLLKSNCKVRWVNYKRVGPTCEPATKSFSALNELARLASMFQQQTDGAGNISVKLGSNMYVTTSGCSICNLSMDDIVRVLSLRGNQLQYEGKGFPSSEALMHYLVYEATGATFVVHNHYIPTTCEMNKHSIKMIPPKEVASVALAEDVAEASKHSNIVYIQKHGLVFHASSLAECKNLLQTMLLFENK